MKENYEGFCKHVEAWKEAGIPYGISDLIRLAEKYNTPVPEEIINNWPIYVRLEK